MSRAQIVRRVVVFLVLTFGLSAIFYVLIITGGEGLGMWTLPLMMCPGLSAITTKLIFDRNLKGLGWKPDPAKWLVLAYLIPLLYSALIYGAAWLLGLGGFDGAAVAELAPQLPLASLPTGPAVIVYALFMGTVIFVAGGLPGSLGEELGWRGFLFPELYKVMPFTGASLLMGVIWGLYHLPLILFSDYNSSAPRTFAVVMFFISVTAMGFMLGWFRLKSGSVWPAVIAHSSHNVFLLNVFDPLTSRQPRTDYFVTEFGVGLALVTILLAVYFWTRRDELPAPERPVRNASGSMEVNSPAD